MPSTGRVDFAHSKPITRKGLCKGAQQKIGVLFGGGTDNP